MNKEIIQLQEELAHQNVEISRLSDELYAQQREIMQLRKQIGDFRETLESVSHTRLETEETPPPHY